MAGEGLIGYEIEVRGLDEQLRKLERFAQIAEPYLRSGLSQGMALVEREAKQQAPVGVTGELRSSIGEEVTYASGLDVQGHVYASAPHAAAVEKAAKAHFPPVSTIAYWVDRKLGVVDGFEIYGIALAIARRMARVGQRAQPFLKPAYQAQKVSVLRKLKEGADRAMAAAAVNGGRA